MTPFNKADDDCPAIENSNGGVEEVNEEHHSVDDASSCAASEERDYLDQARIMATLREKQCVSAMEPAKTRLVGGGRPISKTPSKLTDPLPMLGRNKSLQESNSDLQTVK